MTTNKKDDFAHILGTRIKTISGELKQSNGNKGVNQSDMLWYLIHKFDNISSSINEIKDNIDKKFVTKEFCQEVHKNIEEKEKTQTTQKRFTTGNVMTGVSMIIAVGAIIISSLT